MSSTLTLRRALVVLLVTVIAAVAAFAALSSGRAVSPPAAAAVTGSSDVEPTDQDQPEIGTAIMMVRNADGSITTTER